MTPLFIFDPPRDQEDACCNKAGTLFLRDNIDPFTFFKIRKSRLLFFGILYLDAFVKQKMEALQQDVLARRAA